MYSFFFVALAHRETPDDERSDYNKRHTMSHPPMEQIHSPDDRPEERPRDNKVGLSYLLSSLLTLRIEELLPFSEIFFT